MVQFLSQLLLGCLIATFNALLVFWLDNHNRR